MKKTTAKSILLMVVMAVILMALTGCGGNKIVATRDVDDYMGKYTETLEVKFKDDKIDKVTMTMEYEDKEKAAAMASILKIADDTEGMEVKQKGKKCIVTMNSDSFADEQGFDEDISKDDLKKSLEDAGYTVK